VTSRHRVAVFGCSALATNRDGASQLTAGDAIVFAVTGHDVRVMVELAPGEARRLAAQLLAAAGVRP
jgi:hypothetical protein